MTGSASRRKSALADLHIEIPILGKPEIGGERLKMTVIA
jgi:hypothetical protein